jgi:hypothetical protein
LPHAPEWKAYAGSSPPVEIYDSNKKLIQSGSKVSRDLDNFHCDVFGQGCADLNDYMEQVTIRLSYNGVVRLVEPSGDFGFEVLEFAVAPLALFQ